MMLSAAWFETELGPMVAIADDTELYLLEFATRRGLEREIALLRKRGYAITLGDTQPLQTIQAELLAYFSGRLMQFNTPYRMFGTLFQRQVWAQLLNISYGKTQSYAQQATAMGKPTAYRAVANANGSNQLAILIPCHRIISSDGSLGGYGGGIAVKQWLLQHEQHYRGESHE